MKHLLKLMEWPPVKRILVLAMVLLWPMMVVAQDDVESEKERAVTEAAREALKKAAEEKLKAEAAERSTASQEKKTVDAKSANSTPAAGKATKPKAAKKKRKRKRRKKAKKRDVPPTMGFGDLPSWDEAASEPPKSTSPTSTARITANWDAASGPEAAVSYPWIEHHGYFRVRGDLFYNFDLDTYRGDDGFGSSPFQPPLTELDQVGNQHPESPNHRFSKDSETLAGANLRFRYDPTIHVTESVRLRSTIDVLDNVVMGSTPYGGPHTFRSAGANVDLLSRSDASVGLLTDRQRPPETGVNGWRDAVRVKRVWGEWKTQVGLLAAGRMPNHWGLGMVANNGNCLDCDFGDSVDRIMGVTNVFDTYLAISWDFPSEGATGFSGNQTWLNQPDGQPYDLDQRDDVNQWTIAIFQRPQSRTEFEQRDEALNQKRQPTFDWGIMNVIRTQSFESGYQPGGPPIDGRNYQLHEVNGFSYTPDLWLDFQVRPTATEHYRVQFEAAVTLGSIEEVPQLLTTDSSICVGDDTNPDTCDTTSPRQRDILRYGYALEFDARNGDLYWGVHHGLASGDGEQGFGYLDQAELPNEPSLFEKDESLTAFRFNRDYQVDLILFREIIGGVTNAAYFKPYLRYHFVNEDTEAWGFQLAILYGHAMDKNATPGQDNPLGLEFDLELFIQEYDVMKWSFAYGLLFPMAGLDFVDPESGQRDESGTAQTMQILMGIEF